VKRKKVNESASNYVQNAPQLNVSGAACFSASLLTRSIITAPISAPCTFLSPATPLRRRPSTAASRCFTRSGMTRPKRHLVIRADPGCGIGYWGIAMSFYHPLWAPPTPADLKKGMAAVENAASAVPKTQRERDYVAAIAVGTFCKSNIF
jgi:hypothetical protein